MGDYKPDDIHDWVIYAVTCKCDMRYVGKTGYKHPSQRWANHIYKLRKGTNDNKFLQKHFNQFDETHFWWEELERIDAATTDEAKRREYYWACKYKSYHPDYGWNINRIHIKDKILPWPDASNKHARRTNGHKYGEVCRRLTELNKRRWADPVWAAAQKKRISDATTEYWKDVKAGRRKHPVVTEEGRKTRSRLAKARWADPVWAEKCSRAMRRGKKEKRDNYSI